MYRFQVENKFYGDFLKTISRIYGGIYTELRKISEEEIAKRIDQPQSKIVQVFNYLQQIGVITYIPRKDKPQVTFTSERLDENQVILTHQNYQQLKVEAFKRMNAVINYASSINKCRSQLLLEYFDEAQTKRCGHCDYCLKRNKMEMSDVEFQGVIDRIKPVLKAKRLLVNEIVEKFPEIPEDNILKVLLYLREYDKVLTDGENRFYWSS
jgi:ATP-dependent DNA helicase RecQ